MAIPFEFFRSDAEEELSARPRSMMIVKTRELRLIATALLALIAYTGPAASADLGGEPEPAHVAPAEQTSSWTLAFTTYGWLPWISGDLTVKGRSFDVDISAGQVIDALD
jgi:hypothetical protein